MSVACLRILGGSAGAVLASKCGVLLHCPEAKHMAAALITSAPILPIIELAVMYLEILLQTVWKTTIFCVVEGILTGLAAKSSRDLHFAVAIFLISPASKGAMSPHRPLRVLTINRYSLRLASFAYVGNRTRPNFLARALTRFALSLSESGDRS
jgi:hypothetical protein